MSEYPDPNRITDKFFADQKASAARAETIALAINTVRDRRRAREERRMKNPTKKRVTSRSANLPKEVLDLFRDLDPAASRCSIHKDKDDGVMKLCVRGDDRTLLATFTALDTENVICDKSDFDTLCLTHSWACSWVEWALELGSL